MQAIFLHYCLRNGKVTELKATCTIIGHFEELPGISEGMVELTEDCTLVAFTDGLVDIKNTEGINYTVEMLKEYVAGNLNLNARQLAQGIMKKAMEFSNGSEIPDDIAILNFKYNKSEK